MQLERKMFIRGKTFTVACLCTYTTIDIVIDSQEIIHSRVKTMVNVVPLKVLSCSNSSYM